MNLVLFNFHDLSLILIIMQCLTLAVLFSQATHIGKQSAFFLCCFLLSIAIHTLDTLIYWCQPLKQHFFGNQILIFYVLKFAPLLEGPFLFWYAKSVIHSDFKVDKRNLIHLAPTLLFPFYLCIIFFDLGAEQVKTGVSEYGTLLNNAWFMALLIMQKFSVFAYAIAAFLILRNHRKRLKNEFSNLKGIDGFWLLLLTVGFLSLSTWNLVPLLFSIANVDIWATHVIALVGNYLHFILLNALAFFSIAYAVKTRKQPHDAGQNKNQANEQLQEEHIQSLIRSMEGEKLYLNPELTIEQLAEASGIPSRQASVIINRQFNKNFFEFTNSYRIEHAKQLLTSKEVQLSMLDIMAESGFNSKSAFNRFFKKYTDMTPTQYKKNAQKALPSDSSQ